MNHSNTLQSLAKTGETPVLSRKLQNVVSEEAHALLRAEAARRDQPIGLVIDGLIKDALRSKEIGLNAAA